MKRLTFALWLGIAPISALADSTNCHYNAPSVEDISATMHRAQLLKQELERQPETIAVLVRQGQDMSSRDLTWSHAGYAVRQSNGDWHIFHNLNICGTASSSLYIQGLYEFLADELVNQNIAILRPRAELVESLKDILRSPVKLNLFHSRRYNLIAWPFAGPYQNSNGWLLEIFARANDAQIWSRNDARRWLKKANYQPSVVNVSGLEKLGAKLFASNIYTDDQPDEFLSQGKVGLNSGDSVIHFISRYSRPVADCEHQTLGNAVCVFLP